VDADRGKSRSDGASLPTKSQTPAAATAGETKDDESVPTGDPSDPWTKSADAMWAYEKNRVDKWKEDINNLLLFAGLFSTVLTGFIVAYYVLLQKPQPDASAQALIIISSQLVAISGQLNTFANGALHLNVTQPIIPSAATLTPASPTSRTTISTCTLWFMALVCSIGAASIGITVSQWLQHHGDKTTSTSQQSVRIWYFRDRGFVEWRVQGIINILPLLLQLSVALFLIGLIQLLFSMNIIVASIVTVLVAALLAFSIGTALIPAFVPKCPYKSPQAWWCFLIMRWVMKHLESLPVIRSRYYHEHDAHEYLLRRLWTSFNLSLSVESFRASMPTFGSWRDFEYFLTSSLMEDNEDQLNMMVHVDEILMDESSLLDIMTPFIMKSDLGTALPAFHIIMQRRAHESRLSNDPNRPELLWYPSDRNGQLIDALVGMAGEMLYRLIHADTSPRYQAEQTYISGILKNLFDALPDAETTTSLYASLCKLAQADAPGLSDDVQKTLVSVASAYYSRFKGRIEGLIRAWPRTYHSASAYSALYYLVGIAGLSDDLRKELAGLVVNYFSFFKTSEDINLPGNFSPSNMKIHTDIRPALLAIRSCKTYEPELSIYGVSCIVFSCLWLPRNEFELIQDELREALAAVPGYFGLMDAAASADRLTKNGSWDSFYWLCHNCVLAAKGDKSLITPEIVDALERLSSLCPAGLGGVDQMRGNMRTLRIMCRPRYMPPILKPRVDSSIEGRRAFASAQ